ncbi:hypothetical protein PYCCODRAFT_1479367, partial [Trametes coccinea BRFM310]
MTALLPQVYHGKIQNVQTKLEEMGGQATDAHVVAGGIKIAAVEERDLEYDPTLYQRDRGDDWDTRSVSSSNLLADPKPPYLDGWAGGQPRPDDVTAQFAVRRRPPSVRHAHANPTRTDRRQRLLTPTPKPQLLESHPYALGQSAVLVVAADELSTDGHQRLLTPSPNPNSIMMRPGPSA